MISIADMKAMYDRYLEQLNWYEDRLKQGVYDQELSDDYLIKISKLQLKVFNIGKQMEEAMEQAYIDNIKQWQMLSTIYNPAIKKPLFKHSRYYKTLSRKSKLLMAKLQAYIQYEIDTEILDSIGYKGRDKASNYINLIN